MTRNSGRRNLKETFFEGMCRRGGRIILKCIEENIVNG
jgi:hypothetical protein